MKNIFSLKKQRGFVLLVSMIFLVIMTLLAVTAIRKSTLDEKIGANLRAQDLAFQAAEKALRFCEAAIDLSIASRTMCTLRAGSTMPVYVMDDPAYNPNDVTANFPNKWATLTNWTNSSATFHATTITTADAVVGVANQPQCMVERWMLGTDSTKWPWVVTARGIGSVNTAIVRVQEVIRCGNY